MRYKFRAYDESNEVMEYGVSVDNGRPVKEGYQLYNTENTVYHSQLMQFTGLTDKNGREIYEGDIVKYIMGMKFTITFHKNAFGWFEGDDFIPFADMAQCQLPELEVIGNIYENPELLKENEK